MTETCILMSTNKTCFLSAAFGTWQEKKKHHWAGRECKSSRKWADLYYIWQEPGDQFASAPPESSCNMIKVTNKGKAACKLARVVAVFAPLKACTAVLSAAFACRTMDPVMETTVPHWLNIKKKNTPHHLPPESVIKVTPSLARLPRPRWRRHKEPAVALRDGFELVVVNYCHVPQPPRSYFHTHAGNKLSGSV